MMLLSFYMLLLCGPAWSENSIIFKKSDESMTLKCSHGSQTSSHGYRGLYVLHEFHEKQEVLFVNFQTPDTVTPRERYKGRIKTKGSPNDLIITVSNLSVCDTGVYSCVYKKGGQRDAVRNVHTAFIKGYETTQCSKTRGRLYPGLKPTENGTASPLASCTTEMGLPLAVLIAVTCITSVVVTLVFLKIVTKVKQWHGSRTRSCPRPSNECVYEDMRNNRQFLAAPELQSSLDLG
ncbi:uncharacterized protein PAE49_004536 isoform 2-T2 [Odontesthes bonariensis]|uniref:uncharacterized protein LOC142379207 isoform X2 n=1 Tax=Odontesthes bonariensis TaxID=219752 RepID=UPI003F5846E6